MATLKLPPIYLAKTVLIADDEPEHLEWLIDYLHAKGYETVVAKNVPEAMEQCERAGYRVYIVDLNIPVVNWPTGRSPNPTFLEYPGLFIVQAARSQGNDGRRVIAYSAHFNDNITTEMKVLYTEYLVKGRPRQLKEKLQALFAEKDYAPLDGTKLAGTHPPAKRRVSTTAARKPMKKVAATASKRGAAGKKTTSPPERQSRRNPVARPKK